jgi:hypothetical protein
MKIGHEGATYMKVVMGVVAREFTIPFQMSQLSGTFILGAYPDLLNQYRRMT